MKLLTQNSKMKKSSQNGITNVNWTIPAFRSKSGLATCPNAGACAIGCYARQGAYMFSNVKKAHEAKLELTQNDTFVNLMINDILLWINKKNVAHLKVRIHDAGDFYSQEYTERWFTIMNFFKNDDRVSFYAYTKQVAMFKEYKDLGRIPQNFTVIMSYGGKQDAMINTVIDRHARVFETLEQLAAAGYADGSDDDMVAANGKNHKIGLVYHGTKNFENTAWDKVK